MAYFVHFLSQPWKQLFSRAFVSFSAKWHFKTTVWALGMLTAPELISVYETVSGDGARKSTFKEKMTTCLVCFIPHYTHSSLRIIVQCHQSMEFLKIV